MDLHRTCLRMQRVHTWHTYTTGSRSAYRDGYGGGSAGRVEAVEDDDLIRHFGSLLLHISTVHSAMWYWGRKSAGRSTLTCNVNLESADAMTVVPVSTLFLLLLFHPFSFIPHTSPNCHSMYSTKRETVGDRTRAGKCQSQRSGPQRDHGRPFWGRT